MQKRASLKSLWEVATTTSVITQDSPVFEASDRVLDESPTLTMAATSAVADDAVTFECWRDELGDLAVATIGEHSFVVLA